MLWESESTRELLAEIVVGPDVGRGEMTFEEMVRCTCVYVYMLCYARLGDTGKDLREVGWKVVVQLILAVRIGLSFHSVCLC